MAVDALSRTLHLQIWKITHFNWLLYLIIFVTVFAIKKKDLRFT